MLEFFKNSGFTVMPLENENKKKGIFSTLGSYAASAVRIPIGLTLGVAIAAVSFVRATIGAGVNLGVAFVGALGVGVSVVAAGVSFGCIRAVDGARKVLGLEPLKDSGILSEINRVNKFCLKFTGDRWQEAKNSFNNVFTGKQDEKYKQSISNFLKRFKKPAPQEEVNDDRDSFSSQRSSTVVTNPLGHEYQDMSAQQINDLLYEGQSKSSDSLDLARRTSFSGYRNTSVDRDREPLLSQATAEDKKKKYDSILSEFSNTGKALTASVQLFFGKRRSKRNEANKRRNRQ